MDGTRYYVRSTHRGSIVTRGPYETADHAERAHWYLETVQKHRDVAVIVVAPTEAAPDIGRVRARKDTIACQKSSPRG